MEQPITNTVARNENLKVFNLEDLWDNRELVELDIKEFLFKGLIVKEKPFRESVKAYNWTQYADKHVAVYCSTDAILPQWATMLVASKLHEQAASMEFGRKEDLLRSYYAAALTTYDWAQYKDQIVVIKGCGSDYVPTSAYARATWELQSVARKLMYGEACSSVPIWRKSSGKKQASGSKKASIKKPNLPSSGK